MEGCNDSIGRPGKVGTNSIGNVCNAEGGDGVMVVIMEFGVAGGDGGDPMVVNEEDSGFEEIGCTTRLRSPDRARSVVLPSDW